MKKILKICVGLAAVFILFLGGVVVYIKIKFPPERIKAMVITEAEKALKRKVEVGKVSFGLWDGLRIERVRISERPDFSKGEFLSANAFRFSFAWAPLLRREVAVHELALEGLKARIIKRKDGTFNISDMASGAQKAQEEKEKIDRAAPETAAIAALQAGSIRLKDAHLHYSDAQAGSETVLRVPLAAIDGFRLSGKFRFSAALDIDHKAGKERQKAVLEAKGSADLAGLDSAKLQADVEQLSFKSEGLVLKGKIHFKNAQAPEIEGEVDSSALDAKALASLVPAAAPDINLPAVKITFSAVQRPPALSVKSFKLEAAGLVLSGRFDIADVAAKEPRIALEAETNHFEIGPLMEIHPMTRGKGISGTGFLKLAAKGTSSALDVPAMEMKFQIAPIPHETLKMLAPVPAGFDLPALKLEAAASKSADNVDIKAASLTLGDLAVKTSGRIMAVSSKNPGLRLSLETAYVSFASFAPYLKGVSKLTGRARLEAEVKGTMAAPEISGSLDLQGAGAEYLGQRLENLTGLIRFTDKSLELPKLTGKVNGGDLTLSFSAQHPDAKTAVVTVNGAISSLDAGALEALASHAPGETPAPPSGAKPGPYTGPVLRTSGELIAGKITHPNFSSGKAVLRWNLTGVTPEFKLMNGNAKFDVGSGKMVKLLALAKQKGGLLRGMVMPLEALEKARKLGIAGLNVPSLDEVPFDKIVGDYSFSNGVMTMQPSLLEGPTLRAETTGLLDLPASQLDLKINMQAAGLGRIDLTVKGPMDDPSIRPAISKMIQEKGKEILKEQGRKLLENLFK